MSNRIQMAEKTRRRPLHTCGVSFLAIVHTLNVKTTEINGPIGSLSRRTTKLLVFANPVIYAMMHMWLVILSFIDDHIVAAEKMIEFCFPSLAFVFNKVDGVLHVVETTPGRLEDILNRRPSIFHLLEWAVSRSIKLLNFLITALTDCGSESAMEKDIMVDTNCREETRVSTNETYPPPLENTEDANDDNAKEDEPLTFRDSQEDDNKFESAMNSFEGVMDEVAQEDVKLLEPIEKEIQDEGKEEEKGLEKIVGNDIDEKSVKGGLPILDLFDIGWGAHKM
ncbi:hypothetical protein Drorol1_Dr00008060 [Drosera rotundifolia]